MLDRLNLRYHVTQVQWSASIFVACFKQKVETNKQKNATAQLKKLLDTKSIIASFLVISGLAITNPAQVLAFLALAYLQNRCRVLADSNNHCYVNLTASGMRWEMDGFENWNLRNTQLHVIYGLSYTQFAWSLVFTKCEKTVRKDYRDYYRWREGGSCCWCV